LRHQAGPGWEHGYPANFVAGLIAMFLLSALVLLCYANANRMERLLGTSGTTILTSLSAFILFAIGVQILWNGLSAGIPQILAHVPH
jgi:multiple antibiotic resistance protein